MTNGQLDANLRRFYAEARKKDGETYGKKTLLGFRHGIERYLNQPNFSRNLKMSTDRRFTRSNQMLDAQLVQLKKLGKENSQHKPTLEDEDMEKLKSSDALSLSNPLSLLRNVWFHIVLYFCRRGREGQRELQKSSFKLDVDASERNYVTMAHDEVSKNHPGGLKDTSSTEKYARMYETDSPNDGYKAVKLYLSKLNPKSSAFFQYPSRNWAPSDPVWYDNKPLGINKLDNMMKEISQAAQLSRVYTNHSVRATAITLWSNAGVPNRHIMAISGHRNEQSLAHYNTRPSTAQLLHCSKVLSSHIQVSTALVSVEQSTHTAARSAIVVENQQLRPMSCNFDSIFSNCSIQNVQVVVSPGSPSK
ncbi:zinc finger MYM-type protein 2-like [Montipora capricornis]|uniref:zinc finger MYM-type protein 2-like n=1 Tax=Montipora capricornis TaxID=246305 RepID=UPI0035F17C62